MSASTAVSASTAATSPLTSHRPQLVIDGRTISPRSDEAALSGFMVIGSEGRVSLRARGDELADAVSARQAGPFIIDPGGGVGIKPIEHPASPTVVREIFSTTGRVAFVATGDVSLYDRSSCLHDHAAGFGVRASSAPSTSTAGHRRAVHRGAAGGRGVQGEASVRDVIVVRASGK